MTLDYDTRLRKIANALRGGEEAERVTTREFIWWFGAKRRRQNAVDTIREALGKHGLITDPDFQQAYIDEELSFELQQPTKGQPETESSSTTLVESDPTHRINKLEAANREPTTIKPDAPLSNAITIMMSHKYSQLPVMTDKRTVKGMISWESIGKRLALNRPCELVRDFMEETYEEIQSDASLLSAIQRIEANDYVLVRNRRNEISGIVTSSDLTQQFHLLGEPFLLIGEIENYIRIMLQPRFTPEELADAKDPNDKDRQIKHVSDLSFGEYIRLVEDKERWEKLMLNFDRKWFVNELQRIRRVRNDVMHFDPDGIAEDDIDALRTFAGTLQELADLKAIGAQSTHS